MRRPALLLLLPAAGCAAGRPAHLAHLPPPGPPPVVYRLGCPDVVRVTFADRPDWDAVASVDVDGGLPLGPAGKAKVEGLTPAEAREAVAHAAKADPARVDLILADPRAGRVFVSGPANGRVRAVAYRGPEPALAFLARTGAVPPGKGTLATVTVVRPNVAAGRPAEMFTIVADSPTDDVLLQPGDAVYLAESRRASFARLLPGWARPAYCRLVGIPVP